MKKRNLILSIIGGILFVVIIISFYTTFSLDTEYSIKSDRYKIKDSNITEISPNTNISLFYQYFDLENCTLKVVDDSNHELTDGYITNRSKTLLYNKDKKVVATYTNIIKGDINEDGLVNQEDLNLFGEYLIQKDNLSLDTFDINDDKEVHINDLILLDKTINSDYQSLTPKEKNYLLQTSETTRIIYQIDPSIGKNTNLIWTSLDPTIAEVDATGKVTGKKEGTTKIILTTPDKKQTSEVEIKVDNTIQLSQKEGIAYIGGDNLEIGIKAVDYQDITCAPEKTEIAECEIKDKKLIIKQKSQGNTNIVVSSNLYGNATFYLDVMSVYLNVLPKYLCTTPGNAQLITISAMNSGKYTFDISDLNVIASAEMQKFNGRNMLRINMGQQAGRATLTVKESHGNQSNQVTIDTYRISIPDIGGVTTIDHDLATTIAGENLGNLTCESQNSELATCEIQGTKLIVHPHSLGQVTIKVKNSYTFREENYACGSTEYLVIVKENTK